MSNTPSTRSVLQTFPGGRLLDLGRALGLVLSSAPARDAQVERLLSKGALDLEDLVGALGRDELKAACRAHGIDDSGRARSELQARLLAAHDTGAAADQSSAAPRVSERLRASAPSDFATLWSQLAQDRTYAAMRLGAIEREMATEPDGIEKVYEVVLRRREPVGLVSTWPAAR